MHITDILHTSHMLMLPMPLLVLVLLSVPFPAALLEGVHI
jgi:hypothetical protein